MQCCARCGREVYSAEQKVACNKIWHSFCFSCFKCGRLLDVGSINHFKGEIFCMACYKCIRGSCNPCNSCARVCVPCRTSCEKLCMPRSFKNNCCSAPQPIKRCASCLSDTQCNKSTCMYSPCLDGCAPSAPMYRCRVSPGCRARRCNSISRCCSRQAYSPPRVPREVANYYNRNHDSCDSCCKNPCLQATHGCPSSESPCARVECSPPKSCCAPSNACCTPNNACLRPRCNPSSKCRPFIKCCPPAECLPSVQCNLPTKCCPPVVKCYQQQKCCRFTKSCVPPDCCPPTKCCTPPKCGSRARCCSAKSGCPTDRCSSELVPPCLSDSCCAREGPCLGKPVCYPPVKCCEPHPEEIICFHPGNGIPPPKCCSSKAPHPCKCDRATRRTMAIYCNTPCCRRCGQKVYAAEKVQFAGNIFHSCCFACHCCNKPLDISNADENEGEIYCRACYCKYFGIQGYGSS